MKRIVAALCLLALPCGASAALPQSGAFAVTLTTTPQAVTRPLAGSLYLRIVNAGASGSPSAWCSRATQSPAANSAGSYEIAAGASEEFSSPNYVPTAPTWCVAASGTVALTVEVQ